MSIHKVGGGDLYGKLVLQWMQVDPTLVKRLSVQIATNGDFTEGYHHFLLPNVEGMTGVSLAISKGPWYFRVGAWNLANDTVSWSGIFGPLAITTDREMKSPTKEQIKILHTQPLEGGLRVHTGLTKDYTVLVEYTTEPTFTLAKMKYRWIRDASKGNFDVLGFESGHLYNLRIAKVDEPKNSIEEATNWLVTKGHRSLPPRRHHSVADHTIHAAEKVLLQEARHTRPRFSSGTDYVNWLAAQEKAKGGLLKQGY